MKRTNINQNVFVLSLLTFFALPLSSCSNDDELIISANLNEVGNQAFVNASDSDNDLEMYFLDGDDVMSEDGKTYVRTSFEGSPKFEKQIKATESYILKSGDVEVLVDCGSQTSLRYGPGIKPEAPFNFSNSEISSNVSNNLLRKISSLCTDGILEYLIVTHSDFDHIASLAVNDGVFDAFINEKTVLNFNNQPVILSQIKTIIDFDCPTIALHSYYEIDKSQRLIDSSAYQRYRYQRDALCQKKMNESIHIPASAFFGDKILTEDGEKFTEELKKSATPTAYADKKILNQNTANEAATPFIDKIYKDDDFVDAIATLNGSLKKDNECFYYSLPFNDNELIILYNWCYDYIPHMAFSGMTKSRIINNASVCMLLRTNKTKFLGLGDNSGYGEEGLVKYYSNSSLLKDITVFKASHHGSTRNEENSYRMFSIIRPRIIVVIGCAQTDLEPSYYDHSAPFIKQAFLDNVSKGCKDIAKPIILYTNISYRSLDEDGNAIFKSGPFYGDIHVSVNDNIVNYANSYIGDIQPGITRDFHIEYEREHENKSYIFNTRNEDGIINFVDLDWVKLVGLNYGGNTNEE